MPRHVQQLIVGALSALFMVIGATASAAVVFTGLDVDFTKAANADPTLPENQDRITDNVWLTRGSIEGLFNIAQEGGYSMLISPADTEWAFQGLNGNPDSGISAENYESLSFSNWQASLNSAVGDFILDRPGVIHLISDDIYLDIVFTDWGRGGGAGGNFSYTRSVIPVPAAVWLFASALGLLGWIRQRKDF